MLSVQEVKDKLFESLSQVNETLELGIRESLGFVLAKPTISDIDSPLFSNSSMDGFAVKAEDVLGASNDSPVSLIVSGDIPAGSFSDDVLVSGQAVRIMTGAPMPVGADCVVPVEDTDFNYQDIYVRLPEKIQIKRAVEAGGYVRQQGEDFAAGVKLISKGKRVTSQDIGILAMLGISEVKVFRKPRVGLLSTGDELLNINEKLSPGKIRNTNFYTLEALVKETGGQVENLGIARDTEDDVEKHLDLAIEKGVDIIVSSAGVSVGAYDYVRTVIEKNGFIESWRVNMRPGKPLAFGKYKDVPFVGLPGNPVSSFIGFEVFLRSAINYMGGDIKSGRWIVKARLSEDVISDGRESYLRANLKLSPDGVFEAYFATHQGSGNLFSISLANGLIIIPAGVKFIKRGQLVDAWPLGKTNHENE